MSENRNRELFFIVGLFALSSMLYFLFPIKSPYEKGFFGLCDFSKYQKDITVHQPGFSRDELAVMLGGYFYSVVEEGNCSSFYSPNISNIPTSNYWHHSIYSNEGNVFAIEDGNRGEVVKINLNFTPSLPIVSLIIEPSDFFSYSDGIYIKGKNGDFKSSKEFFPEPWNQSANYYEKGGQSKRKVFFSFYNKKGKHLYSTYCHSKISGHATRCFPQKSMTLSTSKIFGDKKFKVDFFGNKKNYKSIVLRNGGNDNTKTLFRDAFMQSYLNNLGLTTSENQEPCEVFINGQYWGIHFIQNKFDKNFIAESNAVKEKDVVIVENWKRESGSEVVYNDLMKFFDKVEGKFSYSEFCELFDLENFSLYLAGEIFFANTDWPGNNIKLFKISNSKLKTAKWRFAFFDLDYGLGYTGEKAVSFNMFEYLGSKNDRLSKLYKKLMDIPEFKQKLFDQLQKFKTISDKDIIYYKEKLNGAIDRHTQRWRKPFSKSEWEANIHLIEKFLKNRYTIVMEQFKIMEN